MPRQIRIRVDREKCVGAAMCVAIFPSAFEIDNEGKAIVLTEVMDYSERIVRAAEECPVAAVVIDEIPS